MRITEGQLRRVIREVLLTEARWTPRTLADKGMRIFVERKAPVADAACCTADWIDRKRARSSAAPTK